MKLLSASSGKVIVPNLEVAASLWQRTKGLLGRPSIPSDYGLWILRCNSIHTFFMQFPIDLIFIDRNMQVTKTVAGVRPGRLVLPVWRASSVIELQEGFLQRHPVSIGEKLNVDNPLS